MNAPQYTPQTPPARQPPQMTEFGYPEPAHKYFNPDDSEWRIVAKYHEGEGPDPAMWDYLI